MTDYVGTAIEPNQAWTLFEEWRNTLKEIGIIFWGRPGSFYAMGCVESARQGKLHLKSEPARASFNYVALAEGLRSDTLPPRTLSD